MSNYDELVEFRNKITNEDCCCIFEEDCQLLDRVLDDLEQKDQRIAELECDLENLIAYDLKKSHEYSIKILMQANENLSKQIAELKTENNEFCDYNKKLRKEKQTAVKEFADKLLKIFYTKAYSKDYIEQKLSSAEFRELLGELLKERGIE